MVFLTCVIEMLNRYVEMKSTLKATVAGIVIAAACATTASASVIHGLTKGPGNETAELAQVIAALSGVGESTTGLTALGKIDESRVGLGDITSDAGYGEELSFTFDFVRTDGGEVKAVGGDLAAGTTFTLDAVLIVDGTVSSLYYDGMFDDMNVLDGNQEKGISHISYFGTVSVSTVPLPAAGWLLMAAVGGLGIARRRKS